MLNPKWTVCMCFDSRPVYSYHCRHNPCHASMMLPGTYWALVESILYSSWYLDTAHMDTDRHRLGKSGVEKGGKGKNRGKARKGCHCNLLAFTCISSHNATILLQLWGIFWPVCAVRRSKVGFDVMGISSNMCEQLEHVKKERLCC